MAKSNNNAPKKTLEKPTTAEEMKKSLFFCSFYKANR